MLFPSEHQLSLVLCSSQDEDSLHQTAARLDSLGIEHTIFREPDIGDEATALATRGVTTEERKKLSRYSLWKPP